MLVVGLGLVLKESLKTIFVSLALALASKLKSLALNVKSLALALKLMSLALALALQQVFVVIRSESLNAFFSYVTYVRSHFTALEITFSLVLIY